MTQHCPPHGRLLADKAPQCILPQGGHQRDFAAFPYVLQEDLHRVIQACRILVGSVLNDLGGLDHPLQIADTAVVAVFRLLGALVFKVLTEVAKGPGGLHILNELGTQLTHPIVYLLLHFLQVASGQFVVHVVSSLIISAKCSNARGRHCSSSPE